MPRLAFITEFDGTGFAGFQSQENGRAVQDVLESALAELFKEKIRLTGCSRTDAGVHARCHLSHADVQGLQGCSHRPADGRHHGARLHGFLRAGVMNRRQPTLSEIEALLRAGQLEEAHQSLCDYVKRQPDDAQGWYMLGNLYRRQQLWGEAINHLNRAKLLDPDGPADAAIESIYDIIRFVNTDLMNP